MRVVKCTRLLRSKDRQDNESGTYIVPASELRTIFDELETWASEGYDDEVFRLELGEMTQEALDGLPEFDGW